MGYYDLESPRLRTSGDFGQRLQGQTSEPVIWCALLPEALHCSAYRRPPEILV